MKKILLFTISLVMSLQADGQQIGFYVSGNGYNHEIAVAQEALRCITKSCIAGLKGTGFIKDYTVYDEALLKEHLDSLSNHLKFKYPSYFQKFREDINISPLTFYSTFYLEEEENILFQVKLSMAYETGLLYAKEITLKSDDFIKTPKEKVWDRSSETEPKTTNIPLPPPYIEAGIIYKTRGLNLCSGCVYKKLISLNKERKFLLKEEFEYDWLQRLDGDLLRAKQNGLYGIIDHDNNAVIPIQYDTLTTLSNRYVFASKESKVGVYNMKGELLLPEEYDSIDIEFHYEEKSIVPFFIEVV